MMTQELIQANEEPMHVLPMSTSMDSPPHPARGPSGAKDMANTNYVPNRRQPEDCSDALISWLGARVATLETALADEQKARGAIQTSWAEAQAEVAQLLEWVRN
jgi:hypothetical protein